MLASLTPPGNVFLAQCRLTCWRPERIALARWPSMRIALVVKPGGAAMRLRQRVLAAVAGQLARPNGVVGRGAAILSTAVPVWVPR